jgi:hypothetical protein
MLRAIGCPARWSSGLISGRKDAAIEAFGKNEKVKRVFWTLFVAMAILVQARVVNPVTAQQVVGMITGMGV